MSTAVKTTAAVGTIGGGALGGAALGGAFSPSEDKSKVTTQKATDKADSVPSPSPTNTTPSPVSSGSTTQSSLPKPSPTDPTWSSLSAEKKPDNQTYKGKIGEKYGHLLTGTYGLSNNNNKWWTQKFAEYTKDSSPSNSKLSSEFATTNVTSAFEAETYQTNNPNKALNKVCDSVYQKSTDEITPNGKGDDNKSKLKENLWKYCSNLETPPKTVKEEPISPQNYDSQAIGKLKEGELLSVKENVNVVLWKLKQKDFFALVTVTDPFFKDFHKNNKNSSTEGLLKNKCKEAYSQKNSSASSSISPTQEEVMKYCSINEITLTS